MNEACHLYPLMKAIEEIGWAIPKCTTCWYFCISFLVDVLYVVVFWLLNSLKVLKAEI